MDKIITPFKQGGSVCLRLTGYIEMGRQYRVEKKGNKIVLTEVEIKNKEE